VLAYTLKDAEGNVLESSSQEDGEPIEYVHGYGMLVPGLEAALVGLKTGEAKLVVVSPEEGFGDHDDELVFEVDRTDFPKPDAVKAGDEFIAEGPDGEEVPMRVLEVKTESIVVDANHPLSGMALHYDVLVEEVRAATDEEIEDAASAFEAAGYCDDPTHDHGPPESGEGLVQLTTKKH
jgi:FKBP-type peptidyl-prolyl cis-trans isomerase SlyD